MSNEITLKSCPFCGGEALCMCEHGIYFVGCKKCFAVGKPTSYSEQEAIEAWNRRAENA